MDARKITLLNGIRMQFQAEGISFSYKSNHIFKPYTNPRDYPYFSLILLSAQEGSLRSAVTIIRSYKNIPAIRETIIVGNEKQNLQDIAHFRNIKFTINNKKNSPIITSVKQGLFCISPFSQFAIITPVSKKQLDAKLLDKFLKTILDKHIDYAVPLVSNERMHPIVVSRNGFSRIKHIRKEQGLKYFSKILFKDVYLEEEAQNAQKNNA